MTPSPKDTLNQMWLIADKFREVDDRLPIREQQVFLYVAMNIDSEDLTQVRISEVMGTAQGVVSKWLQKLSDKGGSGLLHLERDPTNDARKTIKLTAKGRRLLQDIQTILS